MLIWTHISAIRKQQHPWNVYTFGNDFLTITTKFELWASTARVSTHREANNHRLDFHVRPGMTSRRGVMHGLLF